MSLQAFEPLTPARTCQARTRGDTFRIGYDDIFREENDDNFVDKQAKDLASNTEHNYANDISFDHVWGKFKFYDIHIKRT